ncbi:hypothetical protein L226DRAFT_496780 [Lentinus tigrinus ALCF2SS1-7]|uniref:uncharacterized protein n=1 Tax=Lentinus tigrinus ALCF2SS1-7 TaxID=1328758 RepID=UPI001165D44D|nr:hypothetical protein L226DRAFT_496780 [Lentinus tigrinus ALCF2SS1-7]
MASIDLTNSAQHSEKEGRLDGNHAEFKPTNDLTTGADGISDPGHGPVGRSRDASPASSASGLSSTKGGAPSPAPTASGAPPLSMPHPKKFSHVNVSRKFLEKTTSAPAHTLSASPVLKTVNPSQKPVSQTTTPHPRLVTAKLTATPQPGSTAGWSRPSSAVPSSTPTPLPGANSKPALMSAAGPNAAPVFSPVGTVIQPQPHSSQDVLPLKKDTSGKPVWGGARGNAVVTLDRVQTDFPTAAEVAQGRMAKASDKNAQPDAATAHKQAVMAELMAEEDTFRGVHLDPNAHHWDEMEEDDDNFLGGVIEFDDGRQYKVQSSDARHPSPPRDPSKLLSPGSSARIGGVDQPVSKEERFADDFDRSWPRSRPGPSSLPPGSASSPSSVSVQSPQESSRVLFNERSNRLEPYSHQRHSGPGAPQQGWRNSRSDYSMSPTEGRRDAPPHTQFQLLQKGSNGAMPHPESPTFSRAPGDRSPISPPDASRFRERPPMRRDHPPWQTNGLHGPDSSRAGPHGPPYSSHRQSRDGPFDNRTRQPAFDSFPSGPDGDHRRQLPPHLSASGGHLPPVRTEDVLPRSPLQPSPSLSLSEPPAPSASSQGAVSPAGSASALPATDLDEVRKVAMHTAAERARLRRQQEEEEREKEKQRAHRKAAEIEERMKAAEQAKAREREHAEAEKKKAGEQVLGIIEEAVSSASLSEQAGPVNGLHVDPSQRGVPTRPTMGRAPSSRGASRPFPARRMSLTTSAAVPSTPADTDTWRRKNPPAVATTRQDSLPNTLVTPPMVLTHTDLEVKEGEDVDVVDFADLGKFVGSEPSEPSGAHLARDAASDFFSDGSVLPQRQPQPPSKADEGPWRRRSSFVHDHTRAYPTDKPALHSTSEDVHLPVDSVSPTEPRLNEPTAPSTVSSSSLPEDHHRRVSGHYQNGMYRPPPPVGPHYREASMSTLNDVMARIKGALDGMHHEAEAPKETQKSQKWLPPALRSSSSHLDFAHPTEVFDVTAIEPPQSPKRAWNIFTVKLSHDSRPNPPPLKTGLEWPRGQRHLRLDVYSWNTIDTPNRRETMSTEYLFGRPRLFKGQAKYFVKLPRTRITRRPQPEGTPAPPVVNLPNTPPRVRTTVSKEASTSSWRKPAVSPTPTWRPLLKDSEGLGLDTVSRSPPPEAPSTTPALESSGSVSSRVAEFRPSGSSGATSSQTTRVEKTGEPQAPVQFRVNSELQLESKSDVIPPISRPAAALPIAGVNLAPSKTLSNGISTSQAGPAQSPWSKSPKAMSIKESPARAPDPEHLKAVWSQTPDQAHIQPVNSLKGIADDLTGVPFSLQDVKSDGGETPPPSGSGPWTRMSAYEVTRAFQQVPSSSSQRPQPNAPIPAPAPAPPVAAAPSFNGVVPPNPAFTFSPPPMGQPGLRPAYPAYSPMLSAPSPTIMYSQSSPVPRPMVVNGGPPPLYGQPMWMPGPPPPQSGGVMRSPYPAQLVPYPSPGGPVPMYASPMPGMPNPPQQQNGMQARPPGGMPLVSPVMQPALPQMYAGSPVLVHAPPVMTPGQPYSLPAQLNRDPMRSYGQSPAAPHMLSPMRQPPQNGYNPVPSGYPRPPW